MQKLYYFTHIFGISVHKPLIINNPFKMSSTTSSQQERYLEVSNQIQVGMMANFTFPKKDEWFISFIKSHYYSLLPKTNTMSVTTIDHPASSIRHAKKRFSFFAPRKSKNYLPSSHKIKKIIQEKAKLDQTIVRAATASIIEKLSLSHSYTKIGVDYKNGNLFFWFEIKDGDSKNATLIENTIQKANEQYELAGLKIDSIVVDEFLNLDVPSDYQSL